MKVTESLNQKHFDILLELWIMKTSIYFESLSQDCLDKNSWCTIFYSIKYYVLDQKFSSWGVIHPLVKKIILGEEKKNQKKLAKDGWMSVYSV